MLSEASLILCRQQCKDENRPKIGILCQAMQSNCNAEEMGFLAKHSEFITIQFDVAKPDSHD